jgi:hypothetical protein
LAGPLVHGRAEIDRRGARNATVVGQTPGKDRQYPGRLELVDPCLPHERQAIRVRVYVNIDRRRGRREVLVCHDETAGRWAHGGFASRHDRAPPPAVRACF